MLAPNPIPQPWSPVTRRVVRRPGYVLRYDGRHRGPSPAMKAMFAAAEENGRRWAQARRATLAEFGCTDAPVRDIRLDLRAGPVRPHPGAPYRPQQGRIPDAGLISEPARHVILGGRP